MNAFQNLYKVLMNDNKIYDQQDIFYDLDSKVKKVICDIFRDKFKKIKRKFSQYFGGVKIDFQSCFKDDVAAYVNDNDLNTININMYRVIKQVQKQIKKKKIDLNVIKNKVQKFQQQNDIIAHQCAHIIDCKKNNYPKQMHGRSFKKQLKMIKDSL